ncbi:MAG: carboxymuconolactone decarboxylase family protein [Lautropia sp.]
MKARFNFATASPKAYQAVASLEHFLHEQSGIPRRLIHLIKLRASIINGCAYCVDMHTKEARKDGLPEQWIALVSTWHEARVYTAAERALLAWTDAITLIAQTRAPDADFDALRAHFSEEQITNLTVAIGTINVWNRLAVGLRSQHPIDEAARPVS